MGRGMEVTNSWGIGEGMDLVSVEFPLAGWLACCLGR